MDRTAIQPPPVMYYDDFQFLMGKKDWPHINIDSLDEYMRYKEYQPRFGADTPVKAEIYTNPEKTKRIIIVYKNYTIFVYLFEKDDAGKMVKKRDGHPYRFSFTMVSKRLLDRCYIDSEGAPLMVYDY